MSNSGVKSGSFDQLAVRYDLSVGEDQDSGEIGTMQLEIFHLDIKSLVTYEKELIVCES